LAGYAASSTACAACLSDPKNITLYATKAAAYSVRYRSGQCWKWIDDIYNNCYCPDLVFDNNWKTSTVVELAKTIFNNNCLYLCPVLADALEEAGCTEMVVLDRLRNATILRSEWIIWNILELDK
jgi:hypothetical protein